MPKQSDGKNEDDQRQHNAQGQRGQRVQAVVMAREVELQFTDEALRAAADEATSSTFGCTRRTSACPGRRGCAA